MLARVRYAGPEKVDALEDVRREQSRVVLDDLAGAVALFAAVGQLAKPFVALEVGRGLGVGERRHGRIALVFKLRGLVQLGAKVRTERDERVEHGVIADDPWADDREAANGREGKLAEGSGPAERGPDDPQHAERQEREE